MKELDTKILFSPLSLRAPPSLIPGQSPQGAHNIELSCAAE